MAQWQEPLLLVQRMSLVPSMHMGSLQLSVAASVPWAFVDIRHACGVYTYTQGCTHTYED